MGRNVQKNDSSPGPLEMLILRTLSVRDLHGYGIVRFIQQSFETEFLIEEGSLFPALQRLELNRWIEGIWGMASHNRRARIYKITAAGRKRLPALTFPRNNWHADNAAAVNLKGTKSSLVFGCVVTTVAFGQQPAPNPPSGRIPVNVCMEPAPELLVSTTKAKSLVSIIFSQIGVNLSWHTRISDCDGFPGQSVRTVFKIRWAEDAPSTSSAGALAAARPFSSSQASVTIYEVPLQRFLSRYANAPEVVFAYVLALELAHVMQGLDHHSDRES